jgi:hypothetical protein
VTLGLFAVTSLAACRGGDGAALSVPNRLWLSQVPKKANDTVGALVIFKIDGRKQYGALYRGSALRGAFELFEWQPGEDGHGRMRLLQDGKSVKIRTETCEPDAGFHGCVLLHGDPTGVVRYQSRRRWGLTPRAGIAGIDVAGEIRALAAADEELAALDLPDEP